MGWAKLDDGWAFHPKLRQAGLEASGLDARAVSYCARYETDGHVPAHAVADLAGSEAKGRKLAKVLVEVGRWHRDDKEGGYRVHDYLVYNPSKAELERRREAERAKKSKARTKADRGSNGTFVPAGQTGGHTEGIPGGVPRCVPQGIPGGVHPYPDPTRPDRDSSSLNHQGVAPPGGDDDDDDDERSTENPDTDPAGVAALVAQRRLGRQPTGSVRNPTGWRRSVAAEVLAEHGAAIAAALANGDPPADVAACLDAYGTTDPPAAGLVPATLAGCPGCGTPTGSAGHAADCPMRVGWDLDEHGMAVRR